MELVKGRPETAEGRLEKEIASYDLLDRLGIEYWRVDTEPAETMEICAQIDKVLGAMICKNLFLCNRQKTAYYMLMMPANKPFKTKELSKQIGSSRLSFAQGEDMEKYLNITPGSLSILGLQFDTEKVVKLLVDEDVLNSEWLGCHPCVNTTSLRMPTKDAFGPLLREMGHGMQTVRLVGE